MNIKLTKLALKNFKGIKELDINFANVTSIKGANATGKTTIVDAFMWLLFGKDSKDRKDFNIKTLDENGSEMHGLEHSVTGVLEIDGQAIILQRLYKEKWVKQRGQAQAELKGHTTEYFINEVPTSQKDYQSRINAIFEETKFKLVTSPLYFSSLKWQDQRKMLLEIIGDIDEETVINYNPSLSTLRELLTDGIDNLSKVVKAKISKLKDQVKSIPVRIDECNNSIVDEDFALLETRKDDIERSIKSLDESIEDKSKVNDQKLELSNKIYELKHEYQEKINKAREDADKPRIKLKKQLRELEYNLQEKESELRSAIRTKEQLEKDIVNSNNSIARYNLENDNLREEFAKVKAEECIFNESKFECPLCHRPFEESDIETKKAEMMANFDEDKQKRLKGIQTKGKANNVTVDGIKANIDISKAKLTETSEYIEEVKSKITETQEHINELSVQLSNSTATQTVTFEGMENLKAQIESLQHEMDSITVDNNIELKARKAGLVKELEGINKLLAGRENNNKLVLRIKELQAEEKALSANIAKLEGQQYLCEEFIRTKVELLEGSINEKFAGSISFKLFNKQINGGLNECCEATVNGVPFSNANTAAQINAGLSIVNTLSEHFGVQAPVFIDNAEAVNHIEHTDSQLIKLYVTKDKKLVINSINEATQEEKEYFEKKIDEIKENITDYSNGTIVEDIFPEAEFVEENLLDQLRWSIYTEQIYKYKNLYFNVTWDAPTTEMQEGQDTNCEISILENMEEI